MTPDLSRLVDGAAKSEARRHPGVVIGAFDARSGQRTVVGAGHTRLPDGPVPGENSLFEIGSITKVFTGLLLAISVVSGEVTLDTPVQTLLSNASVPRRGASEITLEQLATHRSGLPRSPVSLRAELRAAMRGTNPYHGLEAREVLDAVARTRLRRPPGTGPMAYSNLGAGVLGLALVAAARADTYADLVSTRICAPLGMTRTTVLAYAQQDRLATGHRTRRRETDHWTLTGLAGAGALLSSGSDMITFLRAQLDPMSTPLADALTLSQQPRDSGHRFAVALGWMMTPPRSRLPLLWHNGGTAGFRAFAGFRPDHRTAVVVLANSPHSPDPTGFRLITEL